MNVKNTTVTLNGNCGGGGNSCSSGTCGTTCTAPQQCYGGTCSCAPGLTDWHYVCPACGFERSSLQPAINRDDGALDKGEMCGSLGALRRRNFTVLCDHLEALPTDYTALAEDHEDLIQAMAAGPETAARMNWLAMP